MLIMPHDVVYHDDETLFKVRDALVRAGVPCSPEGTGGQAFQCITEMLNAGILFRERPRGETGWVRSS